MGSPTRISSGRLLMLLGIHRQQFVHANQRDRDHIHATFNRQKEAPGMNGRRFPSGVRPPSGKITSGIPAFRVLRPERMVLMDAAGLCWSMQICPERLRCQPTNG